MAGRFGHYRRPRTRLPHLPCAGGWQVWQLPPAANKAAPPALRRWPAGLATTAGREQGRPTGPAPVAGRFGNYRRPRTRPPHRPCAGGRQAWQLPRAGREQGRPTGPAPVAGRLGNYRRPRTRPPHRPCAGGWQVWQLNHRPAIVLPDRTHVITEPKHWLHAAGIGAVV